MDPDRMLRSEEIRNCVYNISEGDQLTDNEQDILQSDAEAYDDSDGESDSFELFTPPEDVEMSNDDTIGSNNTSFQPHGSQSTNETGLCKTCGWQHNGDFHPTNYDFDDSVTGLNRDLDGDKEIDFFHHLLDWDLLSHIASETNKYYGLTVNERGNMPEFSKLNRWTPTNPDEIYCLFGAILLMPHCKKNGLKQYWTTDPLLETPIFSKIFTQDRFLLLLRMLHLDDNSTVTGGDKLYKIRTVIETVRRKFSSSFIPGQNLVIDESLILWKGKLAFRQFIPSKRSRFGIKIFVLCDCKTGLVLDFLIYTGKSTQYTNTENDANISAKVVSTLLQPYLDKNHILYVDNWYSSPQLFEKLHEKQTGACGTVRLNRKNMPCLPKKMRKDEVLVRTNEKMITVRWCDRREVTMLSTVHDHQMLNVTKHGKTVQKPKAVIEYNKNMGAVDKSDMMISFNESARKTRKWYRKLFFHIVDICVLNSYNMFKLHKNSKISLLDFRINLIRQLFESHHSAERVTVQRPLGPNAGDKHPLRLIARHFPRPTPTPAGQTRKVQRKCYVCANTTLKTKKRKDSTFECVDCNVGLCIFPCFEDFHTKKKF